MKTITIYGGSVKTNSPVNEGLFDNISKGIKGFFNSKEGFLGQLLSAVGITTKDTKPETDKYADTVKNYASQWQKAREEALQNDMQYKIDAKVRNFEKNEARKLTKYQAEQKAKELRRKEEADAHKLLMKQIANEQAKIKSMTGITGPEQLNVIVARVEKLYQDATPAEQKVKDNILGVAMDAYAHRDDKNYLKDKYGEEFMKEHPEIQRCIEAHAEQCKKLREGENPDDLFAQMFDATVNGDEFKTDTELADEQAKLQQYLDGRKAAETAATDARKKYDEAAEILKGMEEKKKVSEDAAAKLEKLDKLTTTKAIKDQIMDDLINHEDAKNMKTKQGEGSNAETVLNPENPVVVKLKALGLSDEDIASCCDNSGLKGSELEKKLANVPDTTWEDTKKNLKTELEQKRDAFDQGAYDRNKKIVDDKATVEGLERAVKDYDKQNQDILDDVRKRMGKKDDGTPISPKDVATAISGIQTQRDDMSKAVERAKKAQKQFEDDSKNADAYKSLEKQFGSEVGDLSSNLEKNLITTDTETGREYIESDVKDKDGNAIKIYKPDKDSPSYDEDMKKWDLAISAKAATVPLGEKPPLPDPDADDETKKKAYVEIKQWEANKRAKDAAGQAFTDELKKDPDIAKKGTTPEDILQDKRWMADLGDKNLEDVTNDDENETDIEGEDQEVTDAEKELKDKQKEIEDKKANGEEVSAEDEKALKDAEKKVKDATVKSEVGRKNPAKIWHKKKKKNGEGSTKNYYNKDGDSISPQEYKQRMETFKKNKEKNKQKQEPKPTGESLMSTGKVVFEKRQWTTTPLSKK